MSTIARRTRLCILILALVLARGPAALSAQTVSPLTGFTEVTLEIDAVPRAGADAGIQRTPLKALLELILKQAGIRVLTPADEPQTVGPVPVLSVALRMLRMPSLDGTALAYSVQMSCSRPATNPEDGRQVRGELWSGDTLAAGDRRLIRAHVEDSLTALLERFVNDWRAANPGVPR